MKENTEKHITLRNRNRYRGKRETGRKLCFGHRLRRKDENGTDGSNPEGPASARNIFSGVSREKRRRGRKIVEFTRFEEK